MTKIKGICIKAYQDEDDLCDHEEGLIEYCEIRTHEVGEESDIYEPGYDVNYWKPINK